jgi:hypothetical protein
MGTMGASGPRSTSTNCYPFNNLVDGVLRGVTDIARRVFWANREASLRLAAEDRYVLTQSSS